MSYSEDELLRCCCGGVSWCKSNYYESQKDPLVELFGPVFYVKCNENIEDALDALEKAKTLDGGKDFEKSREKNL